MPLRVSDYQSKDYILSFFSVLSIIKKWYPLLISMINCCLLLRRSAYIRDMQCPKIIENIMQITKRVGVVVSSVQKKRKNRALTVKFLYFYKLRNVSFASN